MSNATWMQRDLQHVWHPCTQMHDHEELPLIPIAKAQGLWLTDFNGHRYMDAISSWWVNIFGHSHPRLNAALETQLKSLGHIMLAGFTHQPIIELSERLVALAPKGLTRCFYADNGASAIEVALKMSMHAWHNQGFPEKNRFVALENSYHGETLGALSVTDIPLFSSTYASLLMPQWRAPSPDCSHLPSADWEAHSLQCFAAMEDLLSREHMNISAVILEPLVQGAAGMRMYHPIYLQCLREACDRYHIHMIADEIAVGFGRTGSMFACEQAAICPDFLCLSKALTAGYLPMSVVMTHDGIYRCFYDRYESLKGFMHSHSYTGNALAAAVALASLDIFEDEQVLAINRTKATWITQAAVPLAQQNHVARLRQCGMILAFDLVNHEGLSYDWRERRGLALHLAALQRGVLVRPIGSTVYIIPPHITHQPDITQILTVM
ncbi:MAG: adenosylmethionine--8-amino-7-oxononanoate transaminase, partial [Pseudomonadales bacterium]|nr:adenosylmethionine--8-amino-7-oxononanoate transaminase [Pseudomonadales bacterium]